MWIFGNSFFVSVVQDRNDPKFVWVRARIPGDLEAFLKPGFPTAENIAANPHVLSQIAETPNADYRFRVRMSRAAMTELVKWHTDHIDYDNFKSSIDESTQAGYDRHSEYLNVWRVMHRWQERVVHMSQHLRGKYFGKRAK